MKLTSDGVYQHAEHGEVLVIGVHHVFDEYDPDSKDGQLQSRTVRFTPEWDDYGPMPSSICVAPVDKFRENVGTQIRTVEFDDPGK